MNTFWAKCPFGAANVQYCNRFNYEKEESNIGREKKKRFQAYVKDKLNGFFY